MPKIEKAPWIEQKFDPRSLKIPPPHFVASGRLEGLKICLHLKKSCASEPVRHKSSSERTYLRRGGGFGRRIRAVCAAAVGAAARLLCVCFACGVGAVCCSVSAVLCLLSLRPVPLAVWAASVLLAVAVLSVVLCLLVLRPALCIVRLLLCRLR